MVVPCVCSSPINLPGSLCSAGITPLHSSYGPSDLRRGDRVNVPGPVGEAAPAHLDRTTRRGVPCLLRLTFLSFRLQPPAAVPGLICLSPGPTISALVSRCAGTDGILGFASVSQARHDDWPNRVRQPADRKFASSCSPPPLTRTQLLSTKGRRSIPEGTSTLPIKRLHRRTRPGAKHRAE